MRNRYSMPNVNALVGALSGNLQEDSFDRETDRLLKMDIGGSTVARNQAAAHKLNIEAEMAQAGLAARQSRGSPDTATKMLLLRDPSIAPETARAHVGRAQGTPFAAPTYANPDQARLAGETLAGLFASSLADKESGAGEMADVMFDAGSSAQRLRAPEVFATDPMKAVVMGSMGTGKAVPEMFGSLTGGLGTKNNFTGEANYNQPLLSSVIGENNASATASFAQAGSNNALRDQRIAETGLLGHKADSDRGIVFDQRSGRAIPITLDGKPIGEKPSKAGVNVNIGGKPLPVGAMKLQQEHLDGIAMASSIDADLGAIVKQLQPTIGPDGKEIPPALELGPLENLWSAGLNMAGQSTPNSRNYASIQSMISTMRNKTLMLHKGVQTEGDAQRVLDELVSSLRDPQVVAQRFEELRALNRRAVEQRKYQIEVLRNNFGAGPLDTGGISSPEAAFGGQGAPANAGMPALTGRTVGTSTAGRPLLENADGSVSSERTITIEADGRHYVIPTIVNGQLQSEENAIRMWEQGQNKEVGVFGSAAEAEAGAKQRSSGLVKPPMHVETDGPTRRRQELEAEARRRGLM